MHEPCAPWGAAWRVRRRSSVPVGLLDGLQPFLNRALDTFASGEYAEAAEAFERLGDYAQAPAYAAYSRGLVL